MTKKKTSTKAAADPAVEKPEAEELGELSAENYREHLAALNAEVVALDAEIAATQDERRKVLNRCTAIESEFGGRYNTPAERVALHQKAVADTQARKLEAIEKRGGIDRSKLDQVLSASNKANQRKVPPRLAAVQGEGES